MVGFIVPIFLLLIEKFLNFPFSIFKLFEKQIKHFIGFVTYYYVMSIILVLLDLKMIIFLTYLIGIFFILNLGYAIYVIIKVLIVQENIAKAVLVNYKNYILSNESDEDE
ncbi:hypothetical protein LN42_06390 [Marinitoga sp. 1137]|nr:hypothetical protein LN42_06390 [Marinitoga sp. 1137]